MKSLISLLSTLFFVQVSAFPLIPDKDVSPGNFCVLKDKHFKEFRYPEKIPYCKRRVSSSLKDRVCKRDGVLDRKGYTVDHIIPLSLGGNNSEANLWCQHRSLYTGGIEFFYYSQLKKGRISRLDAAIKILKCKFDKECSY